jgi:hypothetical protein
VVDFLTGRVPESDIRRFNFLAGAIPKEMARQMGDAAWKTMTRFRAVFVAARLSGRPGLRRITGDLIRSFRVGRTPRGTRLDDIVSWLASRSTYAATHEYGKVIRPKRRRMLAIPLPAAKTEAGAVRGKSVRVARAEMSRGSILIPKGERTLYARRDLTLIRSKKGNLLLVEKTGGRSFIPMYVLKTSVRIPPRMNFFNTFRTWVMKPAALRFFRRALKKAFEKFEKKGFEPVRWI